EREAIRSTFEARGATVRMLGVVTGPAKRDLLAIADALVVPSRILPGGRTEGAPTAALEAMAAGLPVIATQVGGVGSIVLDGKVGLLVPPHDGSALRAAIFALRDDPARRKAMAQRAA